jgi:hypothetical protein
MVSPRIPDTKFREGAMMRIELAIGAALLAAMLCVSWYGWVTLPADARVPIHFGPGAYNNFVSKRVGLLLHPAIAVIIFVVLIALPKAGGTRSGSGPGPVFLPIVMVVLLVVQGGAIWVARRRYGS